MSVLLIPFCLLVRVASIHMWKSRTAVTISHLLHSHQISYACTKQLNDFIKRINAIKWELLCFPTIKFINLLVSESIIFSYSKTFRSFLYPLFTKPLPPSSGFLVWSTCLFTYPSSIIIIYMSIYLPPGNVLLFIFELSLCVFSLRLHILNFYCNFFAPLYSQASSLKLKWNSGFQNKKKSVLPDRNILLSFEMKSESWLPWADIAAQWICQETRFF